MNKLKYSLLTLGILGLFVLTIMSFVYVFNEAIAILKAASL